jgi:hypothetical protein
MRVAESTLQSLLEASIGVTAFIPTAVSETETTLECSLGAAGMVSAQNLEPTVIFAQTMTLGELLTAVTVLAKLLGFYHWSGNRCRNDLFRHININGRLWKKK